MSWESGSVPLHLPHVRVVIEAECSCCRPMFQPQDEGLRTLEAATAHTTSTGHLVILNGTIDAPEPDELELLSESAEGAKP